MLNVPAAQVLTVAGFFLAASALTFVAAVAVVMSTPGLVAL